MKSAPPAIPITGDVEADRLLERDPFALLVGMLLDQQVPMEWAFRGPLTLHSRLGDELDPAAIAAMDRDEFVAVCSEKPAIHRFPSSMGGRVWGLAVAVAEHYGGDASLIWRDAKTGDDLYRRLRELPGYGDEKARIFIAILGKRLGVAPPGWEAACMPFSDDQPRSVADVADAESLAAVREWKKAKRAANKSKQD